MLYVANLRFPDEGGESLERFTRRLRDRTQKYWPELWQVIENQNTDVEERAREVIKKMREYIRRFWRESDKHAKDWYIHRAREYHQRLHILPELLKTDETVRLIKAEYMLDQPPADTPIEQALRRLQDRAEKPSLSPRFCQNPACPGPEGPYFLSSKKSQKYCRPECARPTLLASKREYAKNKRRMK